MKKLFVGNLPFTVTDDDLRNLFAQSGTVDSAKVLMDRDTNRSRGFGFVEMPNDAEAEKAIKDLNGYMWDGRAIVVNEARPMEPRTGGGGGGYNRGGGNDHRGGGSRGGYGGGGGNRDRRW